VALRLTLVACALAVAHGALAEPIGDPTRPPALLMGSDSTVEEAAQPQQLQSVLLATGRKVAVINGQSVALGGQIGDAFVTEISATGVVLRRGTEITRLELLPGIDKKPRRGSARREAQGGKQ
jgi:MSHA biogenesis protein MshK